MDIQNKPLANVESLKKDDAKKSKILREIKRIAGITLLSASIMLTTNCATNKEYTRDDYTYYEEKAKRYREALENLDKAEKLLKEAEQAAKEEAQLRKEAE
ncbi:MAG: hypothetical protein ACPL0A_02785, partial [Candidatus Micrarchaeia archaeon]